MAGVVLSLDPKPIEVLIGFLTLARVSERQCHVGINLWYYLLLNGCRGTGMELGAILIIGKNWKLSNKQLNHLTGFKSQTFACYMFAHPGNETSILSHVAHLFFQHPLYEEWRWIWIDQGSYWEAWAETQGAYCCIWRRQWTPAHGSTWNCWYSHFFMGMCIFRDVIMRFENLSLILFTLY